MQRKLLQSSDNIFRLRMGLKMAIVVFMVLGMTARMEQAGIIGGFAALLAGLADLPGSLRQRAFGLTVFVIVGLIPITLASLIGPNPPALLAFLFIMSAGFTWSARYGDRLAHVGWVLSTWLTLVLGFKVWDSITFNFVGYASGSLMVVFAAIVPPILRGADPASAADRSPLVLPRTIRLAELLSMVLIRASAITLAAFIGQRYFQFNAFWVALTTVLMMPPEVKIHWNRSLNRAIGTVLGAIAGFGLVSLKGSNELMLQAVEIIMAFMLIVTIRRKPYGLFVFFLSIFIITQLGLQGIEVARAGGMERVVATLIGIGIAIVNNAILVSIVHRLRNEGEKAQSENGF